MFGQLHRRRGYLQLAAFVLLLALVLQVSGQVRNQASSPGGPLPAAVAGAPVGASSEPVQEGGHEPVLSGSPPGRRDGSRHQPGLHRPSGKLQSSYSRTQSETFESLVERDGD